MPKNEPTQRPWNRSWVALLALGVLAVAGVAVVVWNLSSPPQMGGDAEVFQTVDALFTAVTSKDEQRLSDCEQRLQDYREAGKLSPDAAAALDAVVRKARSGSWQSAAKSLYGFMRGQKREVAVESRQRDN